MKYLLTAVVGVVVLGIVLATVGSIPLSSVLAFSTLILLLFITVFVFDLT